jgi:HAD superfamily hydrolase (TIGR01549 family)
MADTAIVDVDGTLVDTNYQHVLAWSRAFARVGIVLPAWQIHRHLGMGGDRLVEAVAGSTVERLHGADVRAIWAEEYQSFLYEVRPFEGAGELLDEIRRRGFKVVLASSAPTQQVQHYLDILDAYDRMDAWTSADDVDTTKPEPELLRLALDKVGGSRGVAVGDTPYDVESAGRLDLPAIALRTGGFSTDELTDAGAVQVFDSLSDLRDRLDMTELAHAG